MARGNSRAQSEARSPEVLAVREDMRSTYADAQEAIEKDPTLKAVLGSEEFRKAFNQAIDDATQSVLDKAANGDYPEDNEWPMDVAPQYFRIGNNIYELDLPTVELQLDGDTENPNIDKSSHRNVDDMLDEARIRILSPQEARQFTADEPNRREYYGDEFNLSETKGLTIMSKWNESSTYQAALARIPAPYRELARIGGVANKEFKENGVKVERDTGALPFVVRGPVEKKLSSRAWRGVREDGTIYRFNTEAEAVAEAEKINAALKTVKEYEERYKV